MSEKAVVLLSGGQDSTTCLYWARQKWPEVHALAVFYGQRHRRELEAARAIAHLAGVQYHELHLPNYTLSSTSPLVDHKQKLGQYESAESLPGGLEPTFVPGRNLLFLTIAANRAYDIGAEDIVIGVNDADFGGYPDCRPDAMQRAALALRSCFDRPFNLHAPLQHLDKKQIVELAVELPGCMEALALSHTCYAGERPPCGRCHACLLRAKGFDLAGVVDPIFGAGAAE